jgi:small subunit ribosomal protein S6e
MAFKINIADKGLTFHLESAGESIVGLKIGENINGEDIDSKLKGYKFLISGASDKAGFPVLNSVEGPILKKALLTYGVGMKNKTKGLRKRKTVRGNTLSADIVQINLVIKKYGNTGLKEIFPEQCKPKAKKEEAEKPAEA